MSNKNRNNQQSRKDTPVSNQDSAELTPPVVETQGEKSQDQINRELSGRTDLTEAEVIAAGGQLNNREELEDEDQGDATKSEGDAVEQPVAADAGAASAAPAASAPAPVAEPETPPAPAPVVTAQVQRDGQTSVVNATTGEPVPHTLAVPKDAYELPLGSSAAAKITIAELKDYVTAVSARPRPHDQAAGGLQMGLHHTLVQLVNIDADSFQATFQLAMKIIRDNLDGAFAGHNIHRYTPLMQLPPAQATSFRMLINALVALADPNQQAREIAKRQINIEMALANPKIKEEARQRVLAFFGYQ